MNMISSIVLAAGQSRRMGQPKMLMPWGTTSVIGQVVDSLLKAGMKDIHVVSGKAMSELKEALKDYPVDTIFNKDFANGEMLMSVQVGLLSLGSESIAALIVLGDQPQIESNIVRAIMDEYQAKHSKIIVPSFKMHRGHPWLVDKSYWQEILDLVPPMTMHNFLNKNNNDIDYLVVDTASVMEDLDTQEDYTLNKP